MNFGEIIKKLRIEKEWTQEYVANKLNISVGALSRYETGMYEPKSLDLIKDFATLFSVSTDYLLGKTNSRNAEISNIDSADIAFFNGIKGLNETNKEILKNIYEGLKAKQEQENKKEK